MSAFQQNRNVELSLLFYLTTQINNDWSGVTVVKSQKEVYATSISLPVVCVRMIDTSTVYKELGATTLEDRYLVVIDVYTTSDGQRIDLSYYIKDKLKDGWVHYNHSHPSGDNSSLSRSASGRDMVVEWISDSRVDFGQDVDQKDKFRQSISIRVRYSG
jgi:hypothetical protein